MSVNGKLATSELKDVQPSVKMPGYTLQLPVRAANSYLLFEAFAKARGKDPYITDPGGAYRPDWMQADMLARPTWYGAKLGKVAAAGTSVHGEPPGCVDVSNWMSFGTDSLGKYSPTLDAWFGAFGWKRTISGEPWHYQYNGVTYGGGTVSLAGFILEGNDMPQLIRNPNGGITTVGEFSYQHHSWATYVADKAAYGDYKQLSAEDYTQAVANTQVRLAYLKAQLGGTSASAVDPAVIAAKVAADLADDFARLEAQITDLNVRVGPTAAEIADAVADEQAERLQA